MYIVGPQPLFIQPRPGRLDGTDPANLHLPRTPAGGREGVVVGTGGNAPPSPVGSTLSFRDTVTGVPDSD